jgi:actin-related protein
MIIECFNKCYAKLTPEIYNDIVENIWIYGKTTQIPGLAEKLESELNSLNPYTGKSFQVKKDLSLNSCKVIDSHSETWIT